MHRPGSNPADMQPEDFICDFCGIAWDGTFAMVEGHRGSLICGRCLTVAYTDIVLGDVSESSHGTDGAIQELTCVMCLEAKAEGMWQSPVLEEARVCRTCVNRSAGKLHKDPDWNWSKPVLPR